MSDDLIKRLRQVGEDYDFHENALIYEAADRIEELEHNYASLQQAFEEMKALSLRRLVALKEAERQRDELKASLYGLYELEAERDKMKFALENIRLFAARNRKEDWALLILGFCAEGGVVGSVTR